MESALSCVLCIFPSKNGCVHAVLLGVCHKTLCILCAVLRLIADQVDYLFYGTLNSNTVYSASPTVTF